MSFDQLVEQTHQVAFSNAIELAMQLNGPQLRAFTTEMPCSGHAVPASSTIKKVEAQTGTGRNRSNPDNKAARERRWLVWRDEIFDGAYLDERDLWLSAMDPSSELVDNATMAVGRKIDQRVLGVDATGAIGEGGILGKVTGGKTPTSSTGLPAENYVSHGDAGLTVEKLTKVREMLALANHDMRNIRPVVGLGAKQITDLFGLISSATGLNVLQQKEIVEGHIGRVMGMDLVEYQGLPKAGVNRLIPVWLPKRIKYGVWQDVRSRLWNDSSAAQTPVYRVDTSIDVARTHDEAVMVVECKES
jgi:hypothetical protein